METNATSFLPDTFANLELRGKLTELNILDKCKITHKGEDTGFWYVMYYNDEEALMNQDGNQMLVQRDDARFQIEVVQESNLNKQWSRKESLTHIQSELKTPRATVIINKQTLQIDIHMYKHSYSRHISKYTADHEIKILENIEKGFIHL